ncbi:LysR family transcriptional regulator [Aestuariibius sp. 2305UL40-4]|uniref:LysR family transcriptional regulator n=1 Tax=Aestuariibius violaceus TaxID=3234132 RepID=UPI00345E3360
MRVDWLDDLIALLDRGGVAEAASRRNVTQPAFSRRIKVLEDVLGFDIIDRSARPSGPSPILKAHEAELRKLASSQGQLLSKMRLEHGSGARQIVVASQHAITTALGPEMVSVLTQPGKIHIRLRSANFDECETMLMTREASVALTYRILAEVPAELPDVLTEVTLGHEKLIPVAAQDHARDIMWRFHNGELRLIGYPADVFLGIALSRHILPGLEGKCQVNVVAETGLTTAALQLSRSGLGVAWVPSALARNAIGQGELVELAEELGAIDMELIARRWKTDENPVVLAAWRQLATLGQERAL